MEAQRADLQGRADAAAARQREMESQNALLHAQLQKMTEAQGSGDVPSAGAPMTYANATHTLRVQA